MTLVAFVEDSRDHGAFCHLVTSSLSVGKVKLTDGSIPRSPNSAQVAPPAGARSYRASIRPWSGRTGRRIHQARPSLRNPGTCALFLPHMSGSPRTAPAARYWWTASPPFRPVVVPPDPRTPDPLDHDRPAGPAQAAPGAFGDPQLSGQTTSSRTKVRPRHPLRQGKFVAQVVGRSAKSGHVHIAWSKSRSCILANLGRLSRASRRHAVFSAVLSCAAL